MIFVLAVSLEVCHHAVHVCPAPALLYKDFLFQRVSIPASQKSGNGPRPALPGPGCQEVIEPGLSFYISEIMTRGYPKVGARSLNTVSHISCLFIISLYWIPAAWIPCSAVDDGGREFRNWFFSFHVVFEAGSLSLLLFLSFLLQDVSSVNFQAIMSIHTSIHRSTGVASVLPSADSF